MTATVGKPLPFPLVRYLSRLLTPLLMRLPVSANQITLLAAAAGLGAAWQLALGGRTGGIWAGGLLVLCYVFDNCDGEVARGKNQCSEFGAKFDSFADWLVHTALFAALGWGVAATKGERLWLWLGLAAAVGGTINYIVGFFLNARDRKAASTDMTEISRPSGALAWVLFVFRELFRADFCFIVLALALADGLWLLLPAGAIGAQVYWIMQFFRIARRFHV